MYTLSELESKTFGALKKIGYELNVLPEGDRRRRETWIDAIAGVNLPLLQLLEVSPTTSVEQVHAPIIETVETSPGVEPEVPLESKFGRIVYPRPAQEAIEHAAEASPAASIVRVSEPVMEAVKPSPRAEVGQALESIEHAAEASPGVEVDRVQEPIEHAVKTSPGVEVDPVQKPFMETVKSFTGSGESNGNTMETDGSTRAPQLTYTRTHLRYQRLDASRGSGGGDELESFFAQHKRSDRLLVAAGNDQRGWRQALRSQPNELAAKTHIDVEFERTLDWLAEATEYTDVEFGRVMEALVPEVLFNKLGVYELVPEPPDPDDFAQAIPFYTALGAYYDRYPCCFYHDGKYKVNTKILLGNESDPDPDFKYGGSVIETVETSPGVEVDQLEKPKCAECFDDGFFEDEWGVVKLCHCNANAEPKLGRQKIQSAIAPAAENSPRVDCVYCNSPEYESLRDESYRCYKCEPDTDQNPILTGIALSDTFLARYSPPQPENIRFRSDADGQLSLLDFEVQSESEPPDPDDFESLDAFREAIALWDAQNPEPLDVSLDSMCEWAPCPEEWYEPKAEILPLKASSTIDLSLPSEQSSVIELSIPGESFITCNFFIPTFDAWCDRFNRSDEPPDTGIYARLPKPKPPSFPPMAASQARAKCILNASQAHTQCGSSAYQTHIYCIATGSSTQPARSPPSGDAGF